VIPLVKRFRHLSGLTIAFVIANLQTLLFLAGCGVFVWAMYGITRTAGNLSIAGVLLLIAVLMDRAKGGD
jgi:hypothetical protein